MDKKKYESYDEIHKKLQEAMQEAALSDEAGPYMDPSEDLSFMEEKSADTNVNKKFVISRFGKVAAVIIIVLLGMNVIMLATDSCVSYGDKGLLHRIYEGARGIFTDDEGDKFVKQDDEGNIYQFTNMDQIYVAKDIYRNLYIPEYIPKGYMLEHLIIKNSENNWYSSEYLFKTKDGNYFTIIQYEYEDVDSKNTSGYGEEFTKYNDRIIRIYDNTSNSSSIADIYFENIAISIYGDINKIELNKIALGMKY